jgi:hypothetical protein
LFFYEATQVRPAEALALFSLGASLWSPVTTLNQYLFKSFLQRRKRESVA